jgi:hypothetical protein
MAVTPNDQSFSVFSFSVLQQLVTWGLVVGGWLLVNSQNNIRERRKEVRSSLDKLLKRLDQLEIKAISYHTGLTASYEKATHLKLELSRIKKQIDYLHLLALSFNEDTMIKLRQAITLNNFDTVKFEPQGFHSKIISNISTAKDRVVDQLEMAFADKFKIS